MKTEVHDQEAHMTDNAVPERLLLPEEVAELLGVPKTWVYEAARRKKLPSVAVGRYPRFRRADVQAWIDAGGAPADREEV